MQARSIEELAGILDAEGCTPEEIRRIEEDQGRPLPDEYRRFLTAMGGDAGGLFFGSAIEYPHMLGMRDYAATLLVENDVRTPLPEDAVVFFIHQGYEFRFVRRAVNGVYGWWEGIDDGRKHDFPLLASSLLDMVMKDPNSAVFDRRTSHEYGHRSEQLERQSQLRCLRRR